jgi:hypothetical protein
MRSMMAAFSAAPTRNGTVSYGWSALVPPFAEPFISGQDADLELAPVMNAEDVRKGLSWLG